MDLSPSSTSSVRSFVLPDMGKLVSDLRKAVPRLSSRRLSHAAKWAAEFLVAVKKQQTTGCSSSSSTIFQFPSPGFPSTPRTPTSKDEIIYENEEKVREPSDDNVMLAKTYFDLKEYHECIRALKSSDSPHGIFLRGYAQFLLGEKLKEEEALETPDLMERAKTRNKELSVLRRELSKLHKLKRLDEFGLFLYGMVLKHLDQHEEARHVLVESVNKYPYNWSAWKCLESVCDDNDVMNSLVLDDHIMKQFFYADVVVEHAAHTKEQYFEILDPLFEIFPESNHLLSLRARAFYLIGDFETAQPHFEELRKRDPFRLEDMDAYSNVLYVNGSSGKLSHLAHEVVKIDKYSPQTCNVIGNYYSMKSNYEKSILYFQRAIKLNPRYLSAWTLMGHEYVELKNTAAAIESYRRAVDINCRDYRAWYGLGQTYEMRGMYSYSLYYYKKAAQLRPYDSRMWCAMASSYSHLGQTDQAIKCYLRAQGNNEKDGIATQKLAKLYESLGDELQAAHYYKRVIERMCPPEGARESLPEVVVEALLFLAQFEKRNRNWETAMSYCDRLMDAGGPNLERATALLREIRESRSLHDASINTSRSSSTPSRRFRPIAASPTSSNDTPATPRQTIRFESDDEEMEMS